MLNLKEVLEYKLKLGSNTINVAEILADRLMLAEALDKSITALKEIRERREVERGSAMIADGAIDNISFTIDLKS